MFYSGGVFKPTSASPSRPRAPVIADQPSTSTPLLGFPAVTIPVPSAKAEAQLQNRNILWTSITSACCSVSLVNKVHADFVSLNVLTSSIVPVRSPFLLQLRIQSLILKQLLPCQSPSKWETMQNCLHYARSSVTLLQSMSPFLQL